MKRRRLIPWAPGVLATLVFGLGVPLALCNATTCSMMHASQVAAHSCCEQPEEVANSCCGSMETCDQAPAPLPNVTEPVLPSAAMGMASVPVVASSFSPRPFIAEADPFGSPPPLFTLHHSLLI